MTWNAESGLPRDGDRARAPVRAGEFGEWTTDKIDAECDSGYTAYASELRSLHRHWPSAPTAVRSSVFPEGLEWVGGILPQAAWHDAWWAAKSSQTLALTLLAASVRADATLSWLPQARLLGKRPAALFEVELAEHVLSERPRRTQLDFLALGQAGVVAVEAKFTEQGFGPCSCKGRAAGVCSERVRARPYWEVAARELGLQEAEGGCMLSVAYQPVRNIAAVQAIATPARQAAFVLTYDERNPYFSGVGRWPGWATVLAGLTERAETRFATLSWQELLGHLRADSALRAWAKEKHGLEPGAPS